MACFPVTGSSSITMSPHCSLRQSSLALNPKCKDSIHHTVRWRTSGSSSPKWPFWNNKSSSSSVGSRAACGRFPLTLLYTKSRLRAGSTSLFFDELLVFHNICAGVFVVQVALNTSLKRCKRAWLVDSAIIFYGRPWKTCTEVCWTLRKEFFPRLLFLQLWNCIFAKCSDRKLSFS